MMEMASEVLRSLWPHCPQRLQHILLRPCSQSHLDQGQGHGKCLGAQQSHSYPSRASTWCGLWHGQAGSQHSPRCSTQLLAASGPSLCPCQAVPCHQHRSSVCIYRHFWCPALQIRFLLCLSLCCQDGWWILRSTAAGNLLGVLSSPSPAPYPPCSSRPCSSPLSH